MSQNYSPGEVLKIAVEVEENGKVLYGVLELESRSEQMKEIWAYLKDQEEIHRKVFQDMLDRQKDYIVAEFSPGENQAYLRAIASEYIFTQDLIRKHISKRFESDLEAVEFGISVEKISILTYVALREYIKKDKQVVLDKIIAEEKNHLARLKSLKRAIS